MHTLYMLHTHDHSFVQVKSYARINKPTNENDRGYVSISYNNKVTRPFKGSRRNTDVCRFSLFGAFVFLNTLTPIVLAKLLSSYYLKMMTKASKGDFMRYFYWATAGMAFLTNVGYTATSVREFFNNHPTISSCIIQLSNHQCTIPTGTSAYNVEVLTLVAEFTVIPIAVFIELLISVYTVKNNYLKRQKCVGSRCSSLKLLVQTLALWNILIAIQLFTMTVIPLFVLLLTHPQVTIMYIISLLMIPAGFTTIAAYLLCQCQKRSSGRNIQSSVRCCGSMCLHFVMITATIGLLLTLLILYEVMLLVQVHIETGVKGIVLSLLPSFSLPVLGWYLKRRSQRKKISKEIRD